MHGSTVLQDFISYSHEPKVKLEEYGKNGSKTEK